MTASSKSNGKILTSCHIDVNKKKCNSLDDVTGNGVIIRKTRKKDFTERELKTIGLKIGELVRLSGRDAVDVATEAFPEKGRGGAKHLIKRIVAGTQATLKKEAVEQLISILGMTWTSFEEFTPDPLESRRSNVNLLDYEYLEELWPEALKYLRLYAYAKTMNNEKLVDGIKESIAENMIQAANMIIPKKINTKK